MSVKHCSVLFALCLFPLALGCGDQQTVSWSGEVTFEGAPVESGTVRFEPAGGEGQTAGASIAEGKYSVELTPGKYTLEVIGYRETGQEPAYEGSDETVPVLEEVGRFQETVEVTGTETRDFALKKP